MIKIKNYVQNQTMIVFYKVQNYQNMSNVKMATIIVTIVFRAIVASDFVFLEQDIL